MLLYIPTSGLWLLQKIEWQKLFSILQHLCQYWDKNQCYSLNIFKNFPQIPNSFNFTSSFNKPWPSHSELFVAPRQSPGVIPIFSLSFICTLWYSGTATTTIWQVILSLLRTIKSDLLDWMKELVWISKSQSILFFLFFFVMMVYANTINLHGRKQLICRVPCAWLSGFVFNPFKPLLLSSSSSLLMFFFIAIFLFLQIIIILITLLSLSKLWLLLQKIFWLFALWLESFWQKKGREQDGEY